MYYQLAIQKQKLEAKVAAAGSESTGVQAKPLVSFGPPETWSDAPCRFTHMEASYTRLILLGENGVLYSWHWDGSDGAVRGLHPRALELCPEQLSEGIKAVASSPLRTSVLTNKGKLASWMDDICHTEQKRASWADPSDQGTMAQLTSLMQAELARGYTCETLEQQRRLMRIAYLEHEQRVRRANIKKMQKVVDKLGSEVGRMTSSRRRQAIAREPQKSRPLPVEALEHRATAFATPASKEGASSETEWSGLAVSDKGTVAVASDAIYWWGTCPPQLRIKKKSAEGHESKSKGKSKSWWREEKPRKKPDWAARPSPFGSQTARGIFGGPRASLPTMSAGDGPSLRFGSSAGPSSPRPGRPLPSDPRASPASRKAVAESEAPTAPPETFEAAYNRYGPVGLSVRV